MSGKRCRQPSGFLVGIFASLLGAIAIASGPLQVAAQEAASPPTRDQLLKRFRDEFVPLHPGTKPFPARALLRETGSSTMENSDERMVEFLQPFEIAKYEVTQEVWTAVMGSNPSRWTGPRNSVEQLSYQEAVEFCQRITKLLRDKNLIPASAIVRLPTEAEWEYACRAGTRTQYSFGDDVDRLDDYAWHTGNAAGNDPPVGALKANSWGLYDLHGYLWEWCLSDPKNPDGLIQPNDEAWWELSKHEQAVLRGGSWKDPAIQLTSGFRRVVDRSLRDDAVGLRCVLVMPAGSKQDEQAPDPFEPKRSAEIVAPDAQLTKLWDQGEFTEGPAADEHGAIYFSDIGNRILRFETDTDRVTVFRAPSGRANGLAFNSRGELVACEGANTEGGRRISITRKDGTVETLADSYQGRRFNSPNDLVFDADDNVYFTDPRYVGDEPRELEFEGVFRVTPAGEVTVATREVTKPNGILLSPDGKHAYVAEHHPTGARQLLKFDVTTDGRFRNKSVLYDFGSMRGIDGMAMDEEGNIYATAGNDARSGIYVFSGLGEPLACIELPGAPTNCCFGRGRLNHRLFITAACPADANDDQPAKYGLYSIDVRHAGLTRH